MAKPRRSTSGSGCRLASLLPRGTRVVIDQDEPSGGGRVVPCLRQWRLRCQLEANPDIIGKLKKGQNLYVQAYNMAQNVVTLALPLGDFAQAYDVADRSKKLEKKNKQLQDEIAEARP